MLNKKNITVTLALWLAVIFLWPQIVSAQAEFGVNDLVNSGVRLANTDLRTLIANIINIFLGLLGVIAVLIVLYGGFKWMTSAGSPQKIDEAKRILTNGAIGLAIILAAYGVVRLMFAIATGDFFPGGGGPGGGPGYTGGRGLGAGALESHYQARNATGVPRNTMIYVTFKEPMAVDMIVTDPACNTNCNAHDNLKLIDLRDSSEITTDLLKITYDPADRQTFQINPYGDTGQHLGEDNQQVRYKMVLDGLQTASGRAAFPLTGFYDWSFTVSTELDLTPPRVTAVLPANASIDNPRNVTVQVNFSEAVMPTGLNGASGRYDPPSGFVFNNIVVSDASPAPLIGSYLISNQYRTVEFITDELCGQNSCGGEVYCLPALQQISAVAQGDDVDGGMIRDMAGNILDGDGDGNAGGDYSWSFSTNNAVDLNAPLVISMSPNSDFPMNDPIEIEFSKKLLSSSINSTNIVLTENSATPDINYWMSLADDAYTIYIHHDRFKPLTEYLPTMLSGIQDNLQNCWYPCICDDPGGSCSCDTDPSVTCAAGTHCEEP